MANQVVEEEHRDGLDPTTIMHKLHRQPDDVPTTMQSYLQSTYDGILLENNDPYPKRPTYLQMGTWKAAHLPKRVRFG